MQYGLTKYGERIEAVRGEEAVCPICLTDIIAKCGMLVQWHWAHATRADCDPWYEPETTWHRMWKYKVPEEQREVVIGNHRADIRRKDGTVIELQHSSITAEEIRRRENFYKRLIWIFDARDAAENNRIEVYNKSDYTRIRWKHGRKSVSMCKRAFLDFGCGFLFEVRRVYLDNGWRAWGYVWRESVFVERILFSSPAVTAHTATGAADVSRNRP